MASPFYRAGIDDTVTALFVFGMTAAPIVTSVESIADTIGARTGLHMDRFVRRVLVDADCTESRIGVITGEAHPFGNFAMVIDPADAALSATAAAPLMAGAWPSALIYPNGVTAEVAAAIRTMGFSEHEIDPCMAVDLAAVATVPRPDDCQWMRVMDGEGAAAWTKTFAAGYELPLPVARLFSPLAIELSTAADADGQFFALKRGDQIVATSMLFLADGLAGIYGVSVLPDERGQGLGAYVTAQALAEAAALGYRVGVLQSSPPGHSVYRRLGFADVGKVELFVRLPPEAGA